MNSVDRETLRLSAFFSGDVQGVGFRMRTRAIAGQFAVTGWVKNLPDGRVELEAEGTRSELQRFVKEILHEMGGHVHDHTVDWRPAVGLQGPFRITY